MIDMKLLWIYLSLFFYSFSVTQFSCSLFQWYTWSLMSKTKLNILSLVKFETFSQIYNFIQLHKYVHLLACSTLPVIIWYLIESLMYCYFCSKEGPLCNWGNASMELRKWVCPISKGTLEKSDSPDIYLQTQNKIINIKY